MNPEELRYHKEHTWVSISGKKATIGITDYAQDALGDIVYIDIPEVDAEVEANAEMSEIESTKATSSVIAPLSGTIISVNEDLEDSPEIINEDPYGKGWIAVIEISDESELDDLIDATDYDKFIEEEAG
ncbi:glycine cleavage system protein GcvH [Candidatus Magnetominusculus dajiuhuensis]|uniref:glycine cleavage system protein GcvH n=1 Tax=Candidatus Magnetominusculus dajiuhuensis TaxID=3137712 RepID=UPI0019D8B892|nr:glycine cleavage system protein GcvH [Nitrospirota bacterium]